MPGALSLVFSALVLGLGCKGFDAQPRTGDMVATTRTLPNGLRAVLVHVPGASLGAVDIWVQAGSGLERPEERGAAHLLEHMIFRGTPGRSPGVLDQQMELCGGMANAGTTRDFAHFYATVQPPHVPQAIELLADALRNASLDPTALERERGVILDELARGEQLRERAIRDAAYAAAFAGHPYAESIVGRRETIRALPSRAVQGFHARCYRPERSVVVVAGAFPVARTMEAIDRAFGDWKPRTAGSEDSAPASAGDSEAASGTDRSVRSVAHPIIVDAGPGEGTFEVLAWRTAPVRSPTDALAAELAAACLAEVVETGSADGSRGAEALHGLQGGLLVVWYRASDPGCRVRVLDVVDTLAKQGPDRASIEAAIRRVLSHTLYNLETVDGIAASVGEWAMLGDTAVPLEMEARLRAVKPEDIQRLMGQIADPQRARSQAEAR